MPLANMLKKSPSYCLALLVCAVTVIPLGAQPSPNSPEDLSAIILNLSPQQVEGEPLVGLVRILLLDETGVLLTTYDLAANPITLTSSTGALTPDVVDDPLLFAGGVVNLAPLQIRYSGNSGSVSITASASGVTSSPLLVSFSGYDIMGAVGLEPGTTPQVYSNTKAALSIAVRNGGDQIAIEDPSLKAFFGSGGGSVKVYFEPAKDGQIDSLLIDLPTDGIPAGSDTLFLTLESRYQPGVSVLVVEDTLRLPVEVITGQGLAIVPGSIEPDSVYTGIPFDLSFRVSLGGVQPLWDSAVLLLELVADPDSVVAVVYHGQVYHVNVASDTADYGGIVVTLPTSTTLGSYSQRAWYAVYRDGFRFEVEAPFSSGLTLLPTVALSYSSGSLTPRVVAAGRERYFQFGVFLEGSQSVMVAPAESFLSLWSGDFSATVGFQIPGNTLSPGLNQVSTKDVFVPLELLGTSLQVSASVSYYHPGAANRLLFATAFGGETIQVEALPLIQVVEATVLAPNAPLVNTAQPFRIMSRVANLSLTDMSEFQLRLVTDGASSFDSIAVVDSIPGGDTAEVFFDVAAANQPDPIEIFRVDIATLGLNRLPPVDNIALVTVQRPAELSVSLIVRGADQGYVDTGEGFDLLLSLLNTGEAGATQGRFRINTNGIDLGLPGGATVVEEVVPVGAVRGLSFVAPSFDTVITIDVDLIERPIDLNTMSPAIIGDTAFEVPLAVTSLDVALQMEVADIPSNIVLPGEARDLIVLRIINPATSSVSDIRLESMRLRLHDREGQPLPVRSILEVGSTAFCDDGQRLTRATAGGNHLNLFFEDFTIRASDTALLTLRTKVLSVADVEFAISLAAADIVASFAAGPLEGVPVGASTSDPDGVVLGEVFTVVEPTLAGSFVVRTNPFSPINEPAEFRYILSAEDDVTFVILTLTGDLVHRRDFRAGESGAVAGENVVFWDGRNDQGSLVLNGVYMAVVSIGSGRDRATLKLAVMK